MHQLTKVLNCYDLTAEEYARTFYNELEHKPLDRLLLRRFASENKGKGRIADLGCGTGQTCRFLHEAGATDLVGVDLSGEMIRMARRLNPGIDFEVGNMLELPADDGAFGAALAFYAIVHFTPDEVERAFREIYRVLKPSGQLLLSFHAGTEKTELDEFLGKKVKVTFYFFEVGLILDLLEKCGFRVSEALVRYPYEGVEYPSQRAYILAEK